MSSAHDPTQPKLDAFEARLRGWRPAAGLERDALLYEAGRASGRGAAHGVAMGAAALCIAAMSLGFAWWSERSRSASLAQELEMVMQPQHPAAREHELDAAPGPIQLAELPPNSMLALRRLIRDDGAGLDQPAAPRSPSTESRSGAPPLRAIDRDFEL